VRFGFIETWRWSAPLAVLCRCVGVSKTGFLAWRNRPPSPRAAADRQLSVAVETIHGQQKGRYGSPRIHKDLRAQGQRVSRKRVARIMRNLGISGDPPQRRVCTTDSDHDLPVAPNLLAQDFSASAPDQRWVTDITYIPTDEGWLYLSAIQDLYSRRIVGWAMDAHMETSLVLRALDMAIAARKPQAGLIHHSDRGSQYASRDYRRALADRGIDISMSRRGNCYDNACAESLWARLKVELVHRTRFRTRDEARLAIVSYIEGYYNRIRRHSSLGYISPDDFEAAYHRRQAVAS
jgi:transposase InsO family protein